MIKYYVFAPSKAHAESDIRMEIPSHRKDETVALTFDQIVHQNFKPDDVILIRALHSLRRVSDMRYYIDRLLVEAAKIDCHLMMVSLDTYLMVRNQASPILINQGEPLKVDKPEYDRPPGFFEDLFGRFNRG